MVITGKESRIFWGREASWKGGLTGVHFPFNPMETIVVAKPTFTSKQIRTSETLELNISWSEMLALGEGELSTIYCDPFLLATAFAHKTCAGFGAGLTGLITADFSDDDDIDTLWMHYHKQDQEGLQNIDRTLIGGQLAMYGWTCEKGDLVREKFAVKIPDFVTGVVAFVPDADFDNGYWSDWNEYSVDGYHSTQVDISFGSSGISDWGMKWDSFDLSLILEKTQEHSGESKIASIKWEGNREYTLAVTGTFVGAEKDALIKEVEKDYEDKNKATVKVALTDEDGRVSYLQFTNGFVDEIDSYDIPPASEAYKATVTFKTNKPVLSFSGDYTEETDPCPRITT